MSGKRASKKRVSRERGGEGLTFAQVAAIATTTPGFVEQVERLTDHRFAFLHEGERSPLDRLIDQSSGRDDEDVARWSAIVYDLIWCRMPRYDIRAAQ